jgi:hypothetical protein
MRHIKLISIIRRLFLMHLEVHKLFKGQSMYTMTPMFPMYKDRHMDKFKRVMSHIKVIRMIRRLSWIHLEVVKGAVHVHYDPHAHPVNGKAHGGA